MALFNRGPYGAPMARGSRLRSLLLVLGIVLGLYFLNLAFLWVKIPALSAGMVKSFNVVAGVLIILLAIMVVIRPRY